MCDIFVFVRFPMYFEVIKVSFILKVPVSKADEDGC